MEKSKLSTPTGPLKIAEYPALELGWDNNDDVVLLSLVIPTYQERENIHKMINIINNILEESIPNNYELIVVDDNSPDLTWQVAESLIPEYPQLRVMRRQKERGLSSAVIRGWQAAKGQVLGVIDGDLQHPPEILLQLLSQIKRGADLAVASRHVDGGGVSSWNLVRRFLSRGAQILGLVILPHILGKVSDPMSGYFMVRRNAIAGVEMNPIGYKIILEVIARGKIKEIGEVGYVFCEREEGESKVTWKQYLEYIRHLIRLRLSTGRLGKISQNFNLLITFPLSRFMRFGLVGLSGVFVDMAVLYLLSDALAFPLIGSKILAGELAIFNNFLWNDAWTFGDISIQQRSWKQRIKRFYKFNLICLVGLTINVFILEFVVHFLISNRYIANLIAIGVTTIWNFWLNLKLSWRVTDVK